VAGEAVRGESTETMTTRAAAARGAALALRPTWQRYLWLGAGLCSLVLGFIGAFLPLLPTVPFVLLAACCFSRGSARWERWLLQHPRFGPWVRDWRVSRAVPLKAKLWAWSMMTLSSTWAWWVMPRYRWLPALCCAMVALWLWRLPTRANGAATAHGDGGPGLEGDMSALKSN
jgi:uncharacterized membrane protein YbaN (DUF454 family)